MTDLEQKAQQAHLQIVGTFNIEPTDNLGPSNGRMIMLGPDAEFWPYFTGTPEYLDGSADPMDRWSERVISEIASNVGGFAYFPFGGPPYHPFYSWALRTGRVWASPVSLLVGADMGLNVSFRGAIAVPSDKPAQTAPKPCSDCHQPCKTACPVNALTTEGYDVAACKTYLRENPTSDCRTVGCLVRRACPVSRPQLVDHAQFHMAAFLG
ncbi:MAG: ferredoxin [Boseongicola sp.]|nr:ferredoxin [Boseongicola sp.]MDD9979171.1 ferredoxin [Boseongicola sp.]